MPGGWSQGDGLLTRASPLAELASPETGRTTQGDDSGPYTTLSPAMPKPWAWAILWMWGEGGGKDLPIADFSLESPSLPATRSQAIHGWKVQSFQAWLFLPDPHPR